ncbi:MAG TPA: hypothetical protein VF734_12025 [Pseudonocardiaceae bacterium]
MIHEQAAYRFELYDAEPNAVARALAALLDQNVARCPTRARTARRIPRPVVVHDTNTDTTATLACEQDRATVYNDLAGRPSIIVRADTEQLREAWHLPLTAEPPQVDGETSGEPPTGGEPAAGRHILGQIAGRRIRVIGLLRHPLTAGRVLSLFSTAE